MAFGVYVHIPYCLQICRYCDFTKYRIDKIMPPARYVDLLRREIRDRAPDIPVREIDTVYFGGGTPSLFEPSLILSVLDELANAGFRIRPEAEFTIEIDPTTVDEAKLEAYLKIGLNRFSVGAQTFHANLLEMAGRKHTPADTVEMLKMLRKNSLNYSFDLLFGLPTQTLEEVRSDVLRALEFEPPHLSAYNLTVPESHPMARGRAPDDEQVEMIRLIEDELSHAGVLRYEISNFARSGYESRHNLLYWTDQPYWGLGVAAHSYLPHVGPWGLRFWNAPSLNLYENEINSTKLPPDGFQFARDLPASQTEKLALHQALTDFCHISLRLESGLKINALRLKFAEDVIAELQPRLDEMVAHGLLRAMSDGWTLTPRGREISNLVYEKLTFLAGDFAGRP